MHNHDGKNNKSMMWMMVICCAVPLVPILFVGGAGKALGGSSWVVFGGITAMILAHFFMMGKHKGNGNSDEKKELHGEENKNKDNKDDKSHSGHGCCH